MEWAVWRKSSHSIRACLGAALLDATVVNGNITKVAPAPMPGPARAELAPADRQALAAFEELVDSNPGTARALFDRAVGLVQARGIADEAAAAAAAQEGARVGGPGPVPGPRWGQYCLAMVEHLASALFPGGITTGQVRDDGLVGAGQSTRRYLNLPAAVWGPVTGWEALIEGVREAGPGAAAFVVIGRPNRIGHALALTHTTDRGVVLINPTAPAGHTTGPLTELAGTGPGPAGRPDDALGVLAGHLGPLTDTRALIIGPDGQAITTLTQNPAPAAHALTDPTGPRIGGYKSIQPEDLDRLVRALDAAGPAGLSRTDISTLFKRGRSRGDIDTLLDDLAATRPGVYRTWGQLGSGSRWAVHVGRVADRLTGQDYPVPAEARDLRWLGAPAATTIQPGDLGRLADELDGAGPAGLSRTDISTLFKRGRSRGDIDTLLDDLAATRPGVYRTWRQRGSGTRWAVHVGRDADPLTRQDYPVPAGARDYRWLGAPAVAPAPGLFPYRPVPPPPAFRPGSVRPGPDEAESSAAGGAGRSDRWMPRSVTPAPSALGPARAFTSAPPVYEPFTPGTGSGVVSPVPRPRTGFRPGSTMPVPPVPPVSRPVTAFGDRLGTVGSSFSSLAGAVDPLTVPLANRGLRRVPVAGDGDCFFSALVATAGPGRLQNLQSRTQIRQYLAGQLLARPDLREQVAVTVATRLAEERNQAIARQRHAQVPQIAAQYTLDGLTHRAALQQAEAYFDRHNPPVTLTPRRLTEQDWQYVADQIRTPGSWANVGGDIAPGLAAMVFGLPIQVFDADTGAVYTLDNTLNPDATPITLVRSTNHWDATLPRPRSSTRPFAPATPRSPYGGPAGYGGYYPVFRADTSEAMIRGLNQAIEQTTDPSQRRELQKALESWTTGQPATDVGHGQSAAFTARQDRIRGGGTFLAVGRGLGSRSRWRRMPAGRTSMMPGCRGW
jgi:hypothetical protein